MSENLIENIIHEKLTGDVQKYALDFAAYLRASGMTTGEEHGAVKYKGETVCYYHIDEGSEYPNPWTVWSEGDYSKVPEDEKLIEFIWKHSINNCGNCGSGCHPGVKKTIFGKEFDNVCHAAIDFYIYGGETDVECLECMKKVVDIRKCDINAEIKT